MKTSRWALPGLALSMLLSSLGTSIANVALPTLAEAFGATFQATQWIVLAYLLAITATSVAAGRLGDRWGRRRMLLLGLALFTVASLVSGTAPTLRIVVGARAIQGIGAALMMALSVAFIRETVPKEKTGSAMGLLGSTSAIGTALGPTLGGVLIQLLGWRSIFLVNVPLALSTAALIVLRVDADRPSSERRGTTLSRSAALTTGLVTSFLVATLLMGTLVAGPFYLSRTLGLAAGLIGIVMSVGPVVAALTGVPAGRLVDRFGARKITVAGLMGVGIGSGLLCWLTKTGGVLGYVTPTVVLTAGYALFQTANNTSVMESARVAESGVVSGMLNLSRNLGLIAGTVLMGAVLSLGAGAQDLTAATAEAVASGARLVFGLGAGLAVVALAINRIPGASKGPLRSPACGRALLPEADARALPPAPSTSA